MCLKYCYQSIWGGWRHLHEEATLLAAEGPPLLLRAVGVALVLVLALALALAAAVAAAAVIAVAEAAMAVAVAVVVAALARLAAPPRPPARLMLEA